MALDDLSSILGDPNSINLLLGGNAVTPPNPTLSPLDLQGSAPPPGVGYGPQAQDASQPYASLGQAQPFMMGAGGGAPPMQPPGFAGSPPGAPPAGMPPGGAMAAPGMPSGAPPPDASAGPVPLPRPAPPGAGQSPPIPLPQPAPPGAGQTPPMPQPRPPQAGPPSMPPGAPPPQMPPGPPPGSPPGMPQANFNTPIEPMRRQQQQGGILNALGINLSPERRAGLAAGLSSGSGNKPAGSAFVGSMGAAMQGAEKKGEHEDTEQMKRNQQQFSQTSTAFGDLMKQTQVGNAVQVGNARAKFLEEQAKNLATGGKASAAWQNTPYGRSIVIEGQVQKQADSDRKTMEKQWTLNGTLGPQQEIDKAKMKADSDAMRARLYKQVGLTPEQGAALANTGMEPPYMKGPDGKPMVGADGKKVPNPKFNPFDARHMTDEQFRATVPKGAHYIDTDGQVYTREYDDENQKSRKHDTQKKTEAQPSAGAKAAAVEREADQTSEEED